VSVGGATHSTVGPLTLRKAVGRSHESPGPTTLPYIFEKRRKLADSAPAPLCAAPTSNGDSWMACECASSDSDAFALALIGRLRTAAYADCGRQTQDV